MLSPPEEATGERAMGNQTLLGKEGGGGANDTDGEEEKDREETGELLGTGNPGDSGEG